MDHIIGFICRNVLYNSKENILHRVRLNNKNNPTKDVINYVIRYGFDNCFINEQLLHIMIKEVGHINTIQYLWENKYKYFRTLIEQGLCFSVQYHRNDIVDYLLTYLHINEVDWMAKTRRRTYKHNTISHIIFHAITYHNTYMICKYQYYFNGFIAHEVIRELIKEKYDLETIINVVENTGENRNNVVSLAITHNRLDVVKHYQSVLFSVYATPSAYRRTIEGSTIDIIHFLYENGYIGKYKMLKYAVEYNRIDIIEYLMTAGFDIHMRNYEAFMHAVKYSKLETIQFLVEHGADVKARTSDALRRAICRHRLDVINYLLEKGANINDCTIILSMKKYMYIYRHIYQHTMEYK